MDSSEPTTELEMGASEEDSDGSKWRYFQDKFYSFPIYLSSFCYFIFSNLVIELGNKLK